MKGGSRDAILRAIDDLIVELEMRELENNGSGLP
jgi:hypothetical protein